MTDAGGRPRLNTAGIILESRAMAIRGGRSGAPNMPSSNRCALPTVALAFVSVELCPPLSGQVCQSRLRSYALTLRVREYRYKRASGTPTRDARIAVH